MIGDIRRWVSATFCWLGCVGAAAGEGPSAAPIDRLALVQRHHLTLTNADPLTPLSVGNGELAFTVDITGLQTFPEFHEAGMLLSTMSQWGWHRFPNPEKFELQDVWVPFDTHGRPVPYADGPVDDEAAGGRSARARTASAWLRANPHRLDLARLGFVLRHADGTAVNVGELGNVRQTLELWNGRIVSEFSLDNQPVQVETVCHPTRDCLAVRVVSPLLANRQAQVRLAFPYARGDWMRAADWERPEAHQTRMESLHDRENAALDHEPGGAPVPRRRAAHSAALPSPRFMESRGRRVDFERILDDTHYAVAVEQSKGFQVVKAGPHEFILCADAEGPEVLEFVVAFAPDRVKAALPDFAAVKAGAASHWGRFWNSGGVIDLSGSADPRWPELERRIVLSQYLTAIHCSGSMPPQETGLVENSWFGKPHLEMHWWHAAHFPLWGREALLERSLGWYSRILPAARALAQSQGYKGVRWPKMTDPDGAQSPSSIGAFLIWQQPHPIFYAELLRRARPGRATLERYRDLVFETARFMANFAVWDADRQRYVLGPPVIPAQESYGPQRGTTFNPTYELAYWRWALDVAQQWRLALGLTPVPEWDRVRTNLSKPTVREGVYTAIETPPYTVFRDHPSMLCALGVLPPTDGIDAATMRATLNQVWQVWDWPSTWGWDYPVIAMTAARLGQPERAVDALLVDTPKNRYLANGHNYQRPNLPLYLPGNGGLLYATALMAAGWDGAPPRPAPGFPTNSWVVKHEGLRPAP
jgi:hypothetical protein